MLDSWVRYEGQVKARQQKELADAVIAKIDKELDNPKVLDQILKQAVSDVESESNLTTSPRCPLRQLICDHRNRATETAAAVVMRTVT